MIWRYKAIYIDSMPTQKLSFMSRVFKFIFFWRKSKTNLSHKISIDKIESVTTDGFIDAPNEQHAIFKLMYHHRLYPIEIEQINGYHAKLLAKRIIRLQNIKNNIEKQI